MVCQTCGVPVGGVFCSRCGAQVAPAAAMYGAPPMFIPRVERHVQTLGILWAVFGAYRLIGGLVGMSVLSAMSHSGADRWGFGGLGHFWMGALVPVIGAYTVVVTVLAFLVAYGLMTRQPWGRTLAIVAAILALIRPVLGTALGIYTLWVLAPVPSAVEYDAIAIRS